MDGQEQISSVNAQVAAVPGDTAQPAPAQGVQVQPAPGQGDTSQPAPVNDQTAPDAKGPIPYERFEEINKAKKSAEEQAAQLHAQLMSMQQFVAQMAQQRQQAAPQQEPDPLGMSETDLLDPGKLRQAILKIRSDTLAEANKAVQQMQFQMQYGDFDQLVGTQNPMTGQWMPSELMAEAMRDDPQLFAKIQRSGNPREYAYDIAKRQKQIHDLKTSQQQQTQTTPTRPAPPAPTVAQQIRAAQQTPLSISAATGTGQLDRANAVASMSDVEFKKHWEQLKAGGKF